MRIETERLYLYPISDGELQRLIDGEKDPELKQAYTEMLQGCIREPGNRIWHTVWLMELKSRPGTVVGDLSFKGLASDGVVEIGYGLRDGFCGSGYMTEAVRTISDWALRQQGVTGVEAETEPGNASSLRVLARAGFVPTGVLGAEGPRFRFRGKAEGALFEYDTVLHEMKDSGGAYVPFPWDLRQTFGKGRVKVRAEFDGIPYEGSIVNMGLRNPDGTVCYILGVLKSIRKALRKGDGDTIHVRVQSRD